MLSKQQQGMLLGLIAITAFALTLPMTSLALNGMQPIFIGIGRALVAAVCAAGLLILFRARLPAPSVWPQLVIVMLGVVIGFPVLSAIAMQTVPASHGGVVLAILPILTSAMAALIGLERPGKMFWLVSLLGAALVLVFSLRQGAGQLSSGDTWLFLAVLCAAAGYVAGAQASHSMPAWQVICWALVLSLPLTIVPFIVYLPTDIALIEARAWLGFLYLSLISQLLGFFAWYRGLALGSISKVSQLQLLQPFITIFASALVLGEVISADIWLFVVPVVTCVWLAKHAQSQSI